MEKADLTTASAVIERAAETSIQGKTNFIQTVDSQVPGLTRRRTVLKAGVNVGAGLGLWPLTQVCARPLAPVTFELRISFTGFIVTAKVHEILVSGLATLDDFKSASEVADPQIAAYSATITKVIAANPKLVAHQPLPALGPALIHIGSGAEPDYLARTTYPAAVGRESIFLLIGRRHSSSMNPTQAPMYSLHTSFDWAPIGMERLDEVRKIARDVGHIVYN